MKKKKGGATLWMYVTSDTLYHHGVKGQKWGVRRGPPYPIDRKILRKGSRLNSVSGYDDSQNYKQRNAPMYTYNPDDEWDRLVYTGPFSMWLNYYDGKEHVFEHQYEVVKI